MAEAEKQTQIVLTETEVAYIVHILSDMKLYQFEPVRRVIRLLMSHFIVQKDNPA